MSEIAKKRLSVLINVAYFALILAIFYLIFKTFFGLLVPFITAFIVAAIFDRPTSFIVRKTPLKRGFVSAVTVVFAIGVIMGLFSLLGMGLIKEIKGFYSYIAGSLKNEDGFFSGVRDWLIGVISFLPEKIKLDLTENITSFFNNLSQNGLSALSLGSIGIDFSSLLSKSGGVIKDTVVQIPSVIIAAVITVIASAFMLSDFGKIKSFIIRQFPDKNREKIIRAKDMAITTLKKMIKAYGLIVLITMTELCIGFYALKLLKVFESDYIVPLSLVIAIIDIVPVLGTGTVLIPWMAYSFVTQNIGMGIGLLIIYAAITVIRQIVEPKLMAGLAGVSPIVTITAMYIGTKTFGIFGFFILPFVAILIKKFNDTGIIHLFKNDEGENSEKAPEESAVSSEQVT